MIKHSDELIEASILVKADFTEIKNKAERQSVFNEVLYKYTDCTVYEYPLWENLSHTISLHQQFAWKWLDELLEGKEVILFFELADDDKMFQFKNGAQLKMVLANCYRFIFHITSKETDFILSFNDHDYLIACGKAKQWLEEFHIIKEKNIPLSYD